MSSAGSSYDRRRITVSGPLPHIDQGDHYGAGVSNGRTKPAPIKTMRFPWSSPSAPTSPIRPVSPITSAHIFPSSARSQGHKRGVSGNILSRFNFLKDNAEAALSPFPGDADGGSYAVGSFVSRKSLDDDDDDVPSAFAPRAEGVKTSTPAGSKTRRRKGSLRKTALLGGRRFTSEGRERKNSLLQRPLSTKQSSPQSRNDEFPHRVSAVTFGEEVHSSREGSAHKDDDENAQGQFSYEMTGAASSSDSGWSHSVAVSDHLALVTSQRPPVDALGLRGLASPVDLKSATSQASYASASTTDDDDVLTFHRPAKSFADENREDVVLQKPLSAAATSYFPQLPPDATLLRRRSSNKSRSSPLSRNMTTLANFPEPEPHNYTETEYWGWVILFVTWLTFTVGMGSCLEIWSWAWDVGETPYAPPELENDETLPIVGYYPALIVLTGVVAWVWITVAWVGMKYFRHAKIEV